jgi:hypothetical protein
MQSHEDNYALTRIHYALTCILCNHMEHTMESQGGTVQPHAAAARGIREGREETSFKSDQSGRGLESWEERKTRENTSSTFNPSGHHTFRPDVSPAHRFSHSIFTIFHCSNHFGFFTKVVPKTLICLGRQLSSPFHLICYTICWRHQETPSSKPWEFWRLEGVKIGKLATHLEH